MIQLYILLATVLALIVHEGGHYFKARSLGVKTYGFRLTLRGIGLARDFGTPVQNLAITYAGPLANFFLMGALFLVPWLGVLAVWITVVSFSMGIYNLLPLPGLGHFESTSTASQRKIASPG